MFQFLTLNRIKRINNFVFDLEKSTIVKHKKDLELINEKTAQLKNISKFIETLIIIRFITYVLIYASIASTIVGSLPLFGFIINSVVIVSGFISTTVLIIINMFITKAINAYLIDAQLIASRIIALYSKHETQ